MDRQARKLQIAREQQSHHDGSSNLSNSIELGDGKPLLGTNDMPSNVEEGLSSGGNRISDLTLLSDDEDKEVVNYHVFKLRRVFLQLCFRPVLDHEYSYLHI